MKKRQLSTAAIALIAIISTTTPALAEDRPDSIENSDTVRREQPADVRDVNPPAVKPSSSDYFTAEDIMAGERPVKELMREATTAQNQQQRLESAAAAHGTGKSGEALRPLVSFENSREGALAHLYDGLAELPPGASVEGAGLRIFELELKDGGVSFVVVPDGIVPQGSLREIYGDPDGPEDETVERLALYTEQTEDAKVLAIPEKRGFASTVRLSSGTYGWKSGSRGRVKLTWIKDKVVDSNSSYDWFVYSTYVDADPYARSWATDYFVYDIDLINGVTSADIPHVVNDSVQRDPGTVTSGCSSVKVGAGAYGISVGGSYVTCDKSYEKGDRFGGMHMEYRAACSFWTGYSSKGNKSVSVAYSIEVKTTPRSSLYWWDYGDAAFGLATFDCTGNASLEEIVL